MVIQSKEPITMEFDGEFVIEKEEWLYCPDKNVKVLIEGLVDGVKKLGGCPMRTKILVGFTINTISTDVVDYYENPNRVFLWRDENKTHIGCLSEYTKDFSKKYVELIKHLNK